MSMASDSDHGTAGQSTQARDLPPKPSFKVQSKALFLKNWRYQLKHKGALCCYISTPIVFVIIMVIITQLSRALFNQDRFKCGCKCTECCNGDACFTPTATRPCGGLQDYAATCKTYDKNQCGIEHSTATQAGFCSVAHPASWPALTIIPTPEERVNGTAPDMVIPYYGSDATASADLMSQMLPTMTGPVGVATTVSNAQCATIWAMSPGTAINASTCGAAMGAGTFSVECWYCAIQVVSSATQNSNYGFYKDVAANIVSNYSNKMAPNYPWLATDSQTPQLTFQIDYAVTNPLSTLYMLAKEGDCAAINTWAQTYLTTTPGVWDAINRDVNSSGRSSWKPYGTRFGLLGYVSVMSCLETLTPRMGSVDELNKTLYCAWPAADQKGCPAKNDNTLKSPSTYTTAIDWRTTGGNKMNFSVYTNSTVGYSGEQAPPRPNRIAGSIIAAANGWMSKYLTSNPGVATGLREMPKEGTSLNLDLASLLGPLFFTLVLSLPLVGIVEGLVKEKEGRLRVMMKMHGLSDNTYFLVMYLWWLIVTVLYSLVMMTFGAIAQIAFFNKNNYGIQILFYIAACHANIGWGFLLATFFKRSKTASIFMRAYLVLTSLFASNVLPDLIYASAPYEPVLELIPSFGIFRVLQEMGDYGFRAVYTGGSGLTFKDLSNPDVGTGRVIGVFVAEFFFFMALAWYLERVIDDSTGVRRPWNFLWAKKSSIAQRTKPVQAAELAGGEDVMAEKARVEGFGPGDVSRHNIIVNDLFKVFPGPRRQDPEKVAVKSLTMGVRDGEVLGLLGPNGAGKTTSIGMLTGFLEPTAGRAMVCGLDILTEMDNIYALMGVCPQHDLVWRDLSGRECLDFYAALKNIPPGEPRKLAVDDALRSVNLLDVGDKACGSYSGGMRRRLSVAISMIGAPRVVYMDEPSTGLDPASRRSLWEVVKASKAGKSIILTTHSMQEAEILCDRIGIFIAGELYCIDTPRMISSRYGGYVVFTVTTSDAKDQIQMARELGESMNPGTELTYHVAGTQRFKIPLTHLSLKSVFDKVDAAMNRGLKVLDWAVQHASLEDVFIDVARMAGAMTLSNN